MDENLSDTVFHQSDLTGKWKMFHHFTKPTSVGELSYVWKNTEPLMKGFLIFKFFSLRLLNKMTWIFPLQTRACQTGKCEKKIKLCLILNTSLIDIFTSQSTLRWIIWSKLTFTELCRSFFFWPLRFEHYLNCLDADAKMRGKCWGAIFLPVGGDVRGWVSGAETTCLISIYIYSWMCCVLLITPWEWCFANTPLISNAESFGCSLLLGRCLSDLVGIRRTLTERYLMSDYLLR